MNIRLFFEITKEFFDSMYSLVEEDYEENVNEEKVQENVDEENGDEEKGWDEECECYCNACSISRQILLFIDPNIYENKSD